MVRSGGDRIADAAPLVPVMTLLHHPDLGRVGERAWIEGARGFLGATTPFAPVAGGRARPLGARLAPRGVRLEVSADGVALEARGRAELAVDGAPSLSARVLTADLGAGVTLELEGRVALLLHRLPARLERAPELGMLGESPALHRLRAAAAFLSTTRDPVLLCGESGSGKELAALALHTAGPRARGRFVKVDMASLARHAAAAATHRCLCASQGGTLFLDEVAEAPLEAQVALVRALERRSIVIGERQRPLDVRLVAATDVDLERAVRRGRFLAPLYELFVRAVVRVPPLRERREDVARLLVAFLRDELAQLGMAARLAEPERTARPWLPAWVTAAAVRHDWPGNVRELRDFARQLAVTHAEAPEVTMSAALERLLAGQSAVSSRPPPTSAPARSVTRARRRASSADVRAACGARARAPRR
jgi:two-component system nitrogen regulation response regulator GlnG